MIWWVSGAGIVALLFMAPMLGWFVQPWAPWYFGQRNAAAVAPIVLEPAVNIPGAVSDVERYELARAAGWNAADAVLATAISFAENGSGSPSALSPRNFNGSYDLGLWQINSGWWERFGGRDALTLPLNNARAAHAIYGLQGWCAWSTYLASCGPGHTGSYAGFLTRAQAAALRSRA